MTRKNLKPIHPAIQVLNLSDKVKAYFNKLEFYEILEDKIAISDEFNDLNEAKENRWSFRVDLKYCNSDDLKVFYQAIIDSRRKFLRENNITQGIVFYTWYNAMSGGFYFSIIPKNFKNLLPGEEVPFDCIVNRVNSTDDLIEEFVNDKYKGSIPLDELIPVDPSEDDEDNDEEFIRNFVLNVYWTDL